MHKKAKIQIQERKKEKIKENSFKVIAFSFFFSLLRCCSWILFLFFALFSFVDLFRILQILHIFKVRAKLYTGNISRESNTDANPSYLCPAHASQKGSNANSGEFKNVDP